MEHGTGFRSTMGVLRGEEAVEVDPAIVRIALGDTAFSIETEDFAHARDMDEDRGRQPRHRLAHAQY